MQILALLSTYPVPVQHPITDIRVLCWEVAGVSARLAQVKPEGTVKLRIFKRR